MSKQVEPPAAPAAAPGRPRPKGKFRETVEAVAVALVLALVIRTFIVQAFKIPSGSMEDTLLIGDHLLVNKFIYGVQLPFGDARYLAIRHPQRGDIVVFEFPEDTLNPNLSFWERKDFIKRIIGTPGDVVEIRAKQVFVNGQLYKIPQEVHKEPASLDPGAGCDITAFPRPPYCRDYMPPITVPPGKYLMLGDNRDRSFDSRFWGFVPEANIRGLAFIKYWSWNSDTHLPRWNRLGRPID